VAPIKASLARLTDQLVGGTKKWMGLRGSGQVDRSSRRRAGFVFGVPAAGLRREPMS